MGFLNSHFEILSNSIENDSKSGRIIQIIVNFLKLITVTEQFGLTADPLFGFRVLDYEFMPNIPYYLQQDLQPVIQNKTTTFSFLAQQIEERLFYYFPAAEDLVSKIEIHLDDSPGNSDIMQQKIGIVVHFKPPEAVSEKNREEYKISLNTLRTITI